jgi:ABC-type nickel/cobalt efflux system permease component RcnA
VHPDPSQPVSWTSLIGMGFAGGMVPSPSALLVLLGAIALGRTWFGVALVVAYGLGMAASLVAAGIFLLRIRNRLDRYLSTRRGAEMSKRMAIMPVLTASLVVIGGLYIAVRAGLQY